MTARHIVPGLAWRCSVIPGVLALEYALRHTTRVPHLVLMNPAPASAANFMALRDAYLQKLGADVDRQRQIMAGAAYK